MEQIRDLANVLEQVAKLCDQIIRKSVGPLTQLSKDTKKVVEKAQAKHPNLSEKEIRSKLQAAGLEWINDVRQIKKEVKIFAEVMAHRKSLEEVDAPFFKQVWMGDAFGVQGPESLEALLNDLKEQYENCTLEHLISNL